MATRTFHITGNATIAGNLFVASANVLGEWQYNAAATTAATTRRVAVKKTSAAVELDVTGTAAVSGALQANTLYPNVLHIAASATAPGSTPPNLWRDAAGAVRFGSDEIVTDEFVFTTDKVPALSSDKISGTLNDSSLPTLSASKFTSGTLTLTQIGTPAATLFTGTMTDAQIPSLLATKLTSGTLSVDRIPSLPASVFTSGVLSVARGGTGASSFAANSVLLGNGTGAITTSTALRVSADGTKTSIGTTTLDRDFRVQGDVRVDSGIYVDSAAQPVSAALPRTSVAAGHFIVAETTADNASVQLTITWEVGGVHGSLTCGVGQFGTFCSIISISKTQYGQSAGVVSVGLQSVSSTVKRFIVQTERTMTVGCYMDNNFSGQWKLVSYTSTTAPSSYTSQLFVNVPTSLDSTSNQPRFAAVGQYCYMRIRLAGNHNPGNLVQASVLSYAGLFIHYNAAKAGRAETGIPVGVWKVMGATWGDESTWLSATLMMRVM